MRVIIISLFLVSFLTVCSTFTTSNPVQFQSDIFYEIAQGHKKAVRAWLKTKPNLSIRNQQGHSLLTVAVASGQRKMVQELIRAGAQLNVVDATGKTALDHAVEYGYVKIVCDLAQKGAKVTTAANVDYLKIILKEHAGSLIIRALLWFIPAACFIFGLVQYYNPYCLIFAFFVVPGSVIALSVCSIAGICLFARSLYFYQYSQNNLMLQNYSGQLIA